ncbi:MAG: beta-N-acetylhexosaminidase [Actinomycetota bacterium]|jgi:beta-N-acetylhexosaminidase|nr:beta-N-acetylhexosaminidase [Actinomycetota bacterium]
MTTLIGVAPAQAPSIDDVVARMSLREKVGQLVMFSVNGTGLTSHEREVIRDAHLGSVIIFAKNYDDRTQLAALTAQIQASVGRGNRDGIGALISADQEGGVVKRFPDMPPAYSAPRMGEINDPVVAFNEGRSTGRAMAEAGVNIDLAPVADLDLPPHHIMRDRSFGASRYRVARLAKAFGKGLQARGVAATAKHFPGLGGATLNTDDGRAQVNRTKRELHDIDAVPFKAAVNGDFKLVMLSHAIYPNDGGGRPASVNRYIASKRLRGELGFEGVAISDALEAVAWKFDGNVPAACTATIKAGVDLALITGNVDVARACANSIREAVRVGEISFDRLNRAVARVLELKSWLGLIPS